MVHGAIVLNINEVDPDNVVEAVGPRHGGRSSRLTSAVCFTFGTPELLGDPVGNLGSGVSAARHASKVLGGWVSSVFVSNLQVLLLVFCGLKSSGRFFEIAVVQIRLFVILFR